jgi:hypothetical protein
LSLTATRVVYRQPVDQLPHTAAAMGLNPTESGLLPSLVRGRGLWRIGPCSYLADHMLTDRELAMFDTDARMYTNGAGQ